MGSRPCVSQLLRDGCFFNIGRNKFIQIDGILV